MFGWESVECDAALGVGSGGRGDKAGLRELELAWLAIRQSAVRLPDKIEKEPEREAEGVAPRPPNWDPALTVAEPGRFVGVGCPSCPGSVCHRCK